jgi:hypothetical protein
MAEIRSLNGETRTTYLLGDTADISHLCQFAWYDWVWWLDPTDKPQNRKLGRYLGPSLTSGDIMCSKVLTQKATIKIHSSVFPMSPEDRNSDVIKNPMNEFESELKDKLKDTIAGVPVDEGLAIEELDMITKIMRMIDNLVNR